MGWGAGNIVSDPERKSPAEDLTAQGFGTLRARPRIEQKIDARGVYRLDSYRVMFKRSVKPTGKDGVAFTWRARGVFAIELAKGQLDRGGACANDQRLCCCVVGHPVR